MQYTALPDLLKEHVILITGAGSGIGSAVAKAYARHGATVILLDKKIPALELVYDEIVADGLATPALYPMDFKGAIISDYGDLANSIHDSFSRLDGLVHCAASLGQIAPVQHQDPHLWLETLHINLGGPYLLTRACLALLQKCDNASIIFTTDAHKDTAYWSGYGVAKAAIESLSKQLADELESDGRIRVNCIDPGKVSTPLHARAFPGINPTILPAAEDIVSSYLYLMGKDSLNVNANIIKAQ
ncbi:MAG: NAD(P)-dependent dehydrogenase (short-subunit alcohol dehydrogenase family) [Methylophagaceae bacterium]|jgi:NAD(P)-dependent dehydrogenase (short-subunit alcohol dehydrogenase family)